MADYFVDYDTGDNTAVGTDRDHPWKHAPGDSAATNNPAAATVATGETVWIKGGVTYILTGAPGITISVARYANGSYVKGGQLHGTPWGTGYAVLDGQDDGTVGGGLYLSARSGIVVQGIEAKNFSAAGYAGIYLYGSTSCTISYNYVHHCGAAAVAKFGIEVGGGTKTETAANIIEYNIVHDCSTKCIDSDVVGGNIIRYNTCYNWNDHGINLQSGGNQVYKNTIYHGPVSVKGRAAAVPGFAVKIVSGPADTVAADNLVFNNIIYDCHGTLILEAGGVSDVSGNKFFNNTCYDVCNYNTGLSAFGAVYIHRASGSAGTIHDNEIKNNIYSGIQTEPYGAYQFGVRINSDVAGDYTIGNNNIFSYNLYYSSIGDISCMADISGTKVMTLANFADSGSTAPDYRFVSTDLGTGNSFDNQPTQIFNMNPVFIDPTIYDFHLRSTSPCIDVGLTLSTVLTDDYDGVARPKGTGYDIGAFEYDEYKTWVMIYG